MKKWIALILILSMSLCLLAGCGGGSEKPSEKPAESASESNTKSSTKRTRGYGKSIWLLSSVYPRFPHIWEIWPKVMAPTIS